MENLENIKDKIAKLLAKAEKTDNPHEREAFMQKVQDMLEKYQLDMLDVRGRTGKDKDPLGNTRGGVPSSDAWIFKVASAAAKYFGARLIWEPDGLHRRDEKNKKPFRIFGRESARITHELMMPYFISSVKQQGRAFARDHDTTPSKGTREVGLAFAARLHDLADLADRHRAEVTSRALVPLDIRVEINDAVHAYYPSLRRAAGVRTGYSEASVAYANRINVNTQVNAERQNMRIK